MDNIRRGVLILVYAGHSDQKQYLLVKQNSGSWSLPSGGIEPGETALEAAQREVKEETGIEASTFTATDIINEFSYDSETQGSQQGFICAYDSMSIPGTIFTDEIMETRWVNEEEAKAYLMKPNQYDIFKKLIACIG